MAESGNAIPVFIHLQRLAGRQDQRSILP